MLSLKRKTSYSSFLSSTTYVSFSYHHKTCSRADIYVIVVTGLQTPIYPKNYALYHRRLAEVDTAID